MATCLLLSPQLAAEQRHQLQMTDQYIPRQYTKDHGLPDDEVRDILQTRDGYLWIVTQKGLARFDGKQFVVFDHSNTPEMDEENCLKLAEDIAGNLWIGARGRLLRKSGNQFRLWTEADDLRVRNVNAICASRYGGVWTGSQGRVAHVTETNIQQFVYERGLTGSDLVFALRESPEGALWVGTVQGLYRFDPEKQWFVAADPSPRASKQPVPVVAFEQGRTGSFWALFTDFNPTISYRGPNAWLGRYRDGEWQRASGREGFRLANRSHVHFLLEDQRDNVWLPGLSNSLQRLPQDNTQTVHLGLPRSADDAQCLHEDHEGNLWMGTGRSGLWRWQPRKITTYTPEDGLPHPNAWVVCESPDGSVWIGTDGGVTCLRGNQMETWSEAEGLSRNRPRALAIDHEGTVWIGTSSGLNSLRDDKITQHPFPGEWFEGKIRAILPTRDGALWVAAATGLNRLENGTRTKLTTADGLAHDDVRALLEDSAGWLWIGTFGGGLQAYHEGRFTTYTTNAGLSSGFVWALHEAGDGALWIGTASGLNRLRDGQITALGTRHGLPDNLVNFILGDDLGQLWISHDRGIYRTRLAALNDVAEGRANWVQCVSYTEADGLPSEETNGQKSYPAGCKTRDGRLWFPTTKGVVVFDPALHQEELAPPRLVIEQVRATGELIHNLNPRDPFSEASLIALPRRGEEYQLPPGSGRVLEFDYTANTFVAAERARFRYRLLGLDTKWIEAGTRREAVFTNLKPGAYRFQVIAANHHGVWSEAGATFAFRVAPFVYQTWWFYLACGLVVTALTGGIIVWRLRELRRIHRLEQQSALAAERSRIAKDLHDGLGADLTQLSLLADLADQTGADTAAPQSHLRTLSSTTKQVAQTLKDIIWSANPADTTLDGVVAHICQYAENFLNAAQIACRFDVPGQLPERVLTADERRNLFLAAKEALANAARHAAATEVWLRVTLDNERVTLSLEDNGAGFGRATAASDSSGRGLLNMRQRMAAVGGELRVEPLPERGTRVSLTLP